MLDVILDQVVCQCLQLACESGALGKVQEGFDLFGRGGDGFAEPGEMSTHSPGDLRDCPDITGAGHGVRVVLSQISVGGAMS